MKSFLKKAQFHLIKELADIYINGHDLRTQNMYLKLNMKIDEFIENIPRTQNKMISKTLM